MHFLKSFYEASNIALRFKDSESIFLGLFAATVSFPYRLKLSDHSSCKCRLSGETDS